MPGNSFPERRIIAFISRVEKLGESKSSRTSIEFDGFDAKYGSEVIEGIQKGKSARPFCLVRVVTTHNRFTQNFQFEPQEGSWVELTLQKPGPFAAPLAFHSQLEEEGYQTYTVGRLGAANLLFGPDDDPVQPRSIGSAVTGSVSLTAKVAQASGFPLQAVTQDKHIRKELWKLKAASEVCVHDVGQASLATIRTRRGRALAHFDAGWPISFNKRTKPRNLPDIARAPVILSHWDWDHLHGFYVFSALQDVTWIAPAQKLGPGAARIAHKLANSGNLKAINKGSIIFGWGELSTCQGKNSPNDTGLALFLFLSDLTACLFVGDAGYDAYRGAGCGMPLDLLIVTHHGAKFSGNVPKPVGRKNRAIVSVGLGNVYKHPDQPSLDQHTAEGWNVEMTCNASGEPRGDRTFP